MLDPIHIIIVKATAYIGYYSAESKQAAGAVKSIKQFLSREGSVSSVLARKWRSVLWQPSATVISISFREALTLSPEDGKLPHNDSSTAIDVKWEEALVPDGVLPILYSHFSVFFKWYTKYYLTKKLR